MRISGYSTELHVSCGRTGVTVLGSWFMAMISHTGTGLLWTYYTYKCTEVIQDKTKKCFGKWIFDVLAYVNFEHTKKLRTAA